MIPVSPDLARVFTGLSFSKVSDNGAMVDNTKFNRGNQANYEQYRLSHVNLNCVLGIYLFFSRHHTISSQLEMFLVGRAFPVGFRRAGERA